MSGSEDGEYFHGAKSVHRCRARIALLKEEKCRNADSDGWLLTGVEIILPDLFQQERARDVKLQA